MTTIKTKKKNLLLRLDELIGINIIESADVFIATLVDPNGYEILKGYGKDPAGAINDLHSTLY